MMKIGVIGLGYVGWPLLLEFSKHFEVIGYDISLTKLKKLKEISVIKILTFITFPIVDFKKL